MLNRFAIAARSLGLVPRRAFHFPEPTSETHHKPGLTAKRIIKVVNDRLKKIDPDRWNGVPISFQTHWRDEGGCADIETCVHVHDALEREFGIEIKDRQILITDVETAFHVINQHHDAI